MIELTEEQRKALSLPEPMLVDPQTRTEYVLVRREVYDRLKSLLEEDEPPYVTAEHMDRVMAEDDANDPHLAAWQNRCGAAR